MFAVNDGAPYIPAFEQPHVKFWTQIFTKIFELHNNTFSPHEVKTFFSDMTVPVNHAVS